MYNLLLTIRLVETLYTRALAFQGCQIFFSEKSHFGLKKEPMEPFIFFKKATIKPHFKAIKRDV